MQVVEYQRFHRRIAMVPLHAGRNVSSSPSCTHSSLSRCHLDCLRGTSHCTDRMIEYGPDLGMPHTRAMGSGLFKSRLKSQEGIARVLYCPLVKRRIVMLHQFVKEDQQTNKTPPRELAIARNRMKE